VDFSDIAMVLVRKVKTTLFTFRRAKIPTGLLRYNSRLREERKTTLFLSVEQKSQQDYGDPIKLMALPKVINAPAWALGLSTESCVDNP
jgi:hypothetical protein